MNIQVKKIRKLYKEILKQIHDVTQNIDITQSDNILKIINMTNINNQFNSYLRNNSNYFKIFY